MGLFIFFCTVKPIQREKERWLHIAKEAWALRPQTGHGKLPAKGSMQLDSYSGEIAHRGRNPPMGGDAEMSQIDDSHLICMDEIARSTNGCVDLPKNVLVTAAPTSTDRLRILAHP